MHNWRQLGHTQGDSFLTSSEHHGCQWLLLPRSRATFFLRLQVSVLRTSFIFILRLFITLLICSLVCFYSAENICFHACKISLCLLMTIRLLESLTHTHTCVKIKNLMCCIVRKQIRSTECGYFLSLTSCGTSLVRQLLTRLDIQNQFQTDYDNTLPHTAPIPHQHHIFKSVLWLTHSYSSGWGGGGVLWVTDTSQRVAPKVMHYSKIEAE